MTAFLIYATLRCAEGNTTPSSPMTIDINCLSNGYFAYTQECSAYISCHNSDAEIKFCPADKIFNEILQICDTLESVECKVSKYARTSSPEDNPCVGQKEGISFPLLSDCRQYILCLGDDKSVIAKCPVSAWYDPKSGNCGPDISPTACLESTSSSPPDSDEPCIDQELGVSYPLVTDCKKYIVCLGNGESAIVNCIYNAWYDPLTGNCGPNVSPTACMETTTTVATTTKKSTSSISTTTTQSTTSTTDLPISPDVCGGLINGEYVAYPDNCSKYIVCVEPIPIAFYCTPGYYFNEKLQVCVDWAQSDCPVMETTVAPPEYTTPGSTAPSICENNSGESFPYPENCQWFIQCINDNVYMMGVCNQEEYYDPSIGKCSASAAPDACLQNYETTTTRKTTVLPTSTTKSTTTTTTTTTTTMTTTPTPAPNPCENVPVGKLVPYPYDCTKFIKCEGSTGVIYDCVEGQEFSAQLERCMAPWIANCTITGRIMKPWVF